MTVLPERTRAFLAALLLSALFVPLVQADDAAPEAALRSGDRFVYDAILETRSGVLRQPDLLTVRLGEPHDAKLMDGSKAHVVAVEAERGAAFWDQDPSVPGGMLVDERTVQWLRTDDGALVHAERKTVHRVEDATGLHERASFTARFDGKAPDGERPWLSTGQDGPARLLDGERVFLAHQTEERLRDARDVVCSTLLPSVAYATSVAATVVEAHLVRTVWRSPDSPLPVLASCAYTGTDAQGAVRESVSLHVRLAAHVPDAEGEPIGRGGASFLPARAVMPTPVARPGLPAEGEAAFSLDLPLSEALAAMEEETPGVETDLGGPTVVFLAATYRPDRWTCVVPESLLPIERHSGPTCGRDGPVAWTRTPTWTFRILDAVGGPMRVVVTRTLVNDVAVDTRVSRAPDQDALALDPGRLPGKMAPVLPVLAHWLPRWGLDHRTWSRTLDASLHIGFEDDGRDALVGTISIAGAGHGVAPPEGAAPPICSGAVATDGCGDGARHVSQGSSLAHAWRHTYRADDGVYLGRSFTDLSDVAPAPPMRPKTVVDRPVRLGPVPDSWPLAAVVGVTVATVAAAAIVAPAFPRWGRRLLAFTLYAHVSREKALEHATRRDLVALVEADPGVTTKELCRALGIGWGTANYHLGVLEQHGLVVSHRSGRYCGWFGQGCDASERLRAATLRSAAAERVLRFVDDRPGCTQREIARAFEVDHAAIVFHARRLEASGLLRKERRGRTVHYFVTEEARPSMRPDP